jgi:hypothetical protein
MASTYTKVAFNTQQPDQPTATKLNKLRDDLSAAIAAAGGGGTGTGDMLKSVYDTNNNGKVDTADSIPWSSVTGRPTTIGDMTKAVYDINGDGISDHAALADSVPWTGVSGKPATFPPDSTAMLKSVYDTNANNKVDAAESADSVPWTGITGKPTSFTPSAHGTTHLDNGSDAIPVVTVSRTGLAPKLNGNAGTYLDGTGTFSGVSGSVNPGTWTNLSLGSGWTAPTQAQYRVEVNGAVSTVYFRGTIQSSYANLSTSPFTVPAIGQPSMTRRSVLAGAQNTGTASDVAAYIATISSAGVCSIYFLTGGPFAWADPAQTQIIALDGLQYSL